MITENAPDMPSRSRSDRTTWLWLIAVAVAGLVAYYPTLRSLARSGARSDSYYAHWLLIPPVTGLFIWLKKDRIQQLPIRGSSFGLLLLIASLLVHIFGVWFRIDFISAFAFVVTIWGFAVYLFGRKVVREIWFPLFYLLFMVPLPQLVINPLAFYMKVFSAKLAVSLYNVVGGTAVLTGSRINFANGETLWMGYECSGLRSLIAMGALGAAFAHVVRATRPRKVLLFFLSLPFAVLSNGIRVTLLCFAANRWGTTTKAFKVFHDGSSPLVFIGMLIGLFGVYKLLSIGDPTEDAESEQADRAAVAAGKRSSLLDLSGRRFATAFGLLAGSAVLVFLSPHALSLNRWMSSLEPVDLPDQVGSWRRTTTEAMGSDGVWAMLNTKSIVLSTYQHPQGEEIQVMVVASDTHRDAFHPPEICMLGAGHQILKRWKEPIKLTTPGTKHLYLNSFVLRGEEGTDTLVLYWFMVGKRSLGSRFFQQLLLILNGARKIPAVGSMIRVTTSLEARPQREALRSAKNLISSLVPLMPRLLREARSPSGIPERD